VAIDSSPLEGAGRVEDTINLLGHAARKVVLCVADLLGWTADRVAREAGIPALLEASVKRALDTEWSDPNAKDEALNTLVRQLDSLDAWLRQRLPEELRKPPLKEHLDTLAQIRTQDLEPDPDGAEATTRAFAKVWLPTGAFPSRIRICAMAERARVSVSTATNATSPRISIPI